MNSYTTYSADEWIKQKMKPSEPTPTIEVPSMFKELLNGRTMEEYLKEVNLLLEGKSASDIVSWAKQEFGESRVVMSSSFGVQSALMLHLVNEQSGPLKTPVIWIDTGYLFKETYQFAKDLQEMMNLNLHVYQSKLSPARMESLYGKLYEDPSPEAHKQYGYLRKVEPMERALTELNAMASLVGLRAKQTSHRSQMQYVNFQNGRFKICPILKWTKEHVKDYMSKFNLPYHPLQKLNYETVGDTHSSMPILKSNDNENNDRKSRFNGVAEECGLHLDMSAFNSFRNSSKSDNPAADSEVLIDTMKKRAVIYSKPTCRFCIATKKLFKDEGIEYADITVGKQIDIQTLQSLIGKPIKTVPQIFLDGKYIGGYQDVCKALGIEAAIH